VHQLPWQRSPAGHQPEGVSTCNGSVSSTVIRCAFGFSEPCTDCRGSARSSSTLRRVQRYRCDDPDPHHQCADPAGVEDGQRIRLPGQGEAGLRGAPSGDLYVTVHVRPDKIFGRDGDDLTVTIPVSFSELALGSTLSVPTLDGKVGVKVPKGTSDGRILRVRGRGVPKRSGGNGDLLVTVKWPFRLTWKAAQERWRPTPRPSVPVDSTHGPDGR